jgi:cellulose synthase/poly-beta-1,6-N-acetylglucosamine synthase-like glycosyltransferase
LTAPRHAVESPSRPDITLVTAESTARRPVRVARRLRFARWLDTLPDYVRRGMLRVLALSALLPLIVLIAAQVPLLPGAVVLVGYGVLVLAATTVMMYLGFACYEDPSVHPLRPRRTRKWLSRKATLRSRTFPALPATPRVSLLVAVRDEEHGIEECVRTMVGSDYPDLEVIVVDDASTDNTAAVLRRLSDELGITVLYNTVNRGKKHALTDGVGIATGQILAFTDSDCVLAPDALARCVQALVANPDLGAVSGHARALNADDTVLTRAQDTWYDGQFRVAKAAEATFGSVSCVSGPLAVFRRDAIVNYLPAWANDTFLGREFRFATDRQLTGYVLGQVWKGAELKRRYPDSPLVTEHDYPERLWRVGYVRSAHVWTTVPAKFKPFVRQQVRWKKSFIRNLCFTGTFMWRRGIGAAALFYGHALFVMVAPLMAVRHLVWAPVNGLFFLTLLYLCGVLTKGFAWAIAFKISNPGTTRWRYRPLMSLMGSLYLSWLLPYSLITIRRGTWARGAQ